jgi:ADP-ribose pyrophosphatase YjhB (NUDIX family)
MISPYDMEILAKIWRKLHLPKSIQLFVMRIFQDQFLIGVTGIILNDKNEILLFKSSYRQTKWGLPGGYIKAKEHPQEALEREIEEESGFVVSVDEELKIRTDRESARVDIGFVGKLMGGEFRKSSEVTEAKFFSFDDLPMLMSKQQLFIIEQVLFQKKLLTRSSNTS